MYPRDVFARYRTKGVLIDTNLLLLFAVGTYKQQRIRTFKRTMQYTSDDFALLADVVRYFERRVTTPNILTEVDNLIRQLPAGEHRALAETLRDIISGFFEIYHPSQEVVHTGLFATLGLSDSATMLCDRDVLIVTDDFALSNMLARAGRDVININHLRGFQ